MAPTPFRRRGKVAKAARTARNLAIADAALALARDRLSPGSHSRRPGGKALLLGGAAVAAAAGLLYKRDKVAGLLPSRTGPYEPPAPHQPGPSNYDAPGPVANTATPVPAPDAQITNEGGSIDEAAEEAAAAAEAANIGGTVSDYAGPSGDVYATEAERPLAEAGQGVSEGQEQAELGLEEAAQPTAPGMSDTERQIEEAIDQAANPLSGERLEPVKPVEDPPAEAEQEARTDDWAPPAAPAAPADEGSEESKEDEGNDWRTWSGRSVKP